jgi:hypothetical protein
MADAPEARRWVADEIQRLRDLSFDDLLALERQKPEHRSVQTADGRTLILETQVVWDDHREKKDLRVLVDVWDSSRRGVSTSIARSDFIRSPDGGFVGE